MQHRDILWQTSTHLAVSFCARLPIHHPARGGGRGVGPAYTSPCCHLRKPARVSAGQALHATRVFNLCSGGDVFNASCGELLCKLPIHHPAGGGGDGPAYTSPCCPLRKPARVSAGQALHFATQVFNLCSGGDVFNASCGELLCKLPIHHPAGGGGGGPAYTSLCCHLRKPSKSISWPGSSFRHSSLQSVLRRSCVQVECDMHLCPEAMPQSF